MTLDPTLGGSYVYPSVSYVASVRIPGYSWASPPIVHATSAASAPMDSASAWQQSGAARFSAVVARKDASGSPSSCLPSTQAPESLAFPRSHRLTHRAELRHVSMKGKRLRTEHLEVRVIASPLAHPRVGLVVAKHRQSAVSRNRLKRRLREIIRTQLLRRLPPIDVVVRAKPSAYTASFAVLERELLSLEPSFARLVAP